MNATGGMFKKRPSIVLLKITTRCIVTARARLMNGCSKSMLRRRPSGLMFARNAEQGIRTNHLDRKTDM